jgi:phosphonate dehydrogenase
MPTLKPRVLVTNRIHAPVRDLLANTFDFDINDAVEPWDASHLRERAHGCVAMMAFMTDHVDADFLDACPSLRMIACALKGADNFDMAACRARGVEVTLVPDLLTAPTAELAIGLMIGLGRNMLAGDAHVRSGSFAGWRPRFYGTGLDGACVGIIGMGAVGRAIAHRLRPFRCVVTYSDANPLPAHAEDAASVSRRDPEALLHGSDYVVLAAPLSPATRHMINRETLARMKPGALLVNAARGSLVDEAAVAEALWEGRLGGYAADVFECEDWAQSNRPSNISRRLLDHPATLFTPHIGSAVSKVRLEIEMSAAREIIAWAQRGRLSEVCTHA